MVRCSGLGALLQVKKKTTDASRETETLCLGKEIPEKAAVNQNDDLCARSALRAAGLRVKAWPTCAVTCHWKLNRYAGTETQIESEG
jgi:hypothetical protein